MIGRFTVADWRSLIAWLRDGIAPAGFGAWTAFTPTMTQSVALTITVDNARYRIIGKLVVVQIRITIGSAGTAGNAIRVASIPAAIAPRTAGSYRSVGTGFYVDSGATFYTFYCELDTATTMRFISHSNANYFGITPAVTAANNDIISLLLAYEIA